MASISLPVSESDVKQMESAGLLSDLPYKATPTTDGKVTVEFTGGDLDLYRFAQRFLHKAETGFLYDPDGKPNNGDEFYLAEKQVASCELTETQLRKLTALVPALKGLGRIPEATKRCSAFQQNVRASSAGVPILFWDRQHTLDTLDDFFYLPQTEYPAVRSVASAVKPGETPIKTEYGSLQFVDADGEKSAFYNYRVLLTNPATGGTNFVEIPLGEGLSSAGHNYDQVKIEAYKIPPGWRQPNADEFKTFIADPKNKRYTESSFRVAISSEGKHIPVAAVPKAGECGLLSEIGTPIKFPMSAEMAARFAVDRGVEPSGMCVDASLNTKGVPPGTKIYRFSIDADQLQAEIDHLEGLLKESDGKTSIRLAHNVVLSHDDAKAFKDALIKARDGDESAVLVFMREHPIASEIIKLVITGLIIGFLFAYMNRKVMTSKGAGKDLAKAQESARIEARAEAEKREYLKEFGENLSERVRPYAEQPAIGRDLQLREMALVLSRNDMGESQYKDPNSPLLLGRAGVGKTEVVEGLAWLIENKDPRVGALHGYTVIKLELGKIKGGEPGGSHSIHELPAIVNGIIHEAITKYGKVIILLDEIHRLVDTGKHSTSEQGIAEEFKEPMGRGELKLVGATTIDEWEKFVRAVRTNEALVSRFQRIDVLEQPHEILEEILARRVRVLERNYKLTMAPDVLRRAIEMAPQARPEAGAQPRCSILFVRSLFESRVLRNEEHPDQRSNSITLTDIEQVIEDQRTGRLQANVTNLLTEVRELHRKIVEEYGWNKFDLPDEPLKELSERPVYEAIRGLRKVRGQLEALISLIEASERGEIDPDKVRKPRLLEAPPREVVSLTGWEAVENYRIDDPRLAVALMQHDAEMGRWYREEFPAVDPPRTLGEMIYRLIDSGQGEAVAETLEALTREGRLLSTCDPGEVVLQVLARATRIPDSVVNEREYRVSLFRELREFRERATREGAVRRTARAEDEARDPRLEEFRRRILGKGRK